MLGAVSSFMLLAAGMISVISPRLVAASLGHELVSRRGVAEYRIVNAAFAGLGAWGLIHGSAGAVGGVAAAWLAAATVRLVAAAVDRAGRDASYWAIFGFEAAAGAAAAIGAARGI